MIISLELLGEKTTSGERVNKLLCHSTDSSKINKYLPTLQIGFSDIFKNSAITKPSDHFEKYRFQLKIELRDSGIVSSNTKTMQPLHGFRIRRNDARVPEFYL